MKRNYLVSLLGLLAAAGLACGQPPEAPLSLDPAALSSLPPPDNPPPYLMPGPAPVLPRYLSGQVEYLLWFVQSERLDPRLSTTDPLLQSFGLPGERGTDRTGLPISGGRFTLGYWLEDYDPITEPNQRLPLVGVEANGFFLGERSLSFLSGTEAVLFRPFFDLNNATTTSFVVAFPGLATGQLSGSAQFQLWGAEANVWANVFSNPPSQTARIDLMAGFRYLQLDGSLQINQNTLFAPNLAGNPAFVPFLPFAGDRLQVFDSFGVENQFYGGQVGMRYKMLFDCAAFTTTVKYGLGTTHQKLDINGSQVLTTPAGAQTRSAGGLLALPSNIGSHSRDRFTQVPEANFNLTLNLTRNISLNAGYTFLYFSRLIRAANQIDRVIDITQIPNFPGAGAAVPTGLGRPAVLFRESDLLIQGLNFGVTFAW